LVIAQPLRERLWEQRIVASYRCGRQADALRAYDAIRRRLRDDLGVEPGPALRALEAAVLDQNPKLDWHETATSRGCCRIHSAIATGEQQPRGRVAIGSWRAG
jgi:DNA-binding SARP family transcriptional activator